MELNQGHMDFQSIALPPELRHHFFIFQKKNSVVNASFLNCECKGKEINWYAQIFSEFFINYFSYLCITR